MAFTCDDLIRIEKFKRCIRNRPDSEGLSVSHVIDLLGLYITFVNKIEEINGEILRANSNSKIIRRINPLSEITENLASYAWHVYYGSVLVWGMKGGDLRLYDTLRRRCLAKVEVKAFVSDGPISYGPTEYWNAIMYVDLRRFITYNTLKIYQVNEPSTSILFENLPVKKPTEKEKGTFGEQARAGRRPRLSFEPTKEYFGERMYCIFSGTIAELLSRAPQSV